MDINPVTIEGCDVRLTVMSVDFFIGVKEKSFFRNHMVMTDGRLRHFVYYSIMNSEWADIKRKSELKL